VERETGQYASLPEADQIAIRSPWRSVGVVTSIAPLVLGAFVFARIAPVMYACFAVGCLLIAVASWRMELRCGSEGFVVCNGFRTRRIPWSEVEEVAWRRTWPWGPAVVLQLRQGNSVVLAATQSPMGSFDSEPSPEGQTWVERVRRCHPTT
jgi:hypothetical protein